MMMALIHSAKSEDKMPVLLSLYNDRSCTKEERMPPEVWLPKFLSDVAAGNRSPSMLLVSPDLRFHKLGFLVKRKGILCFQFDHSLVVRTISPNEFASENKKILSRSWQQENALTFINGELRFVERSKVSYYEQWIGDLVWQHAKETQLTFASLSKNEMSLGSYRHAKRNQVKLLLEQSADFNDSSCYWAWIPSPKPNSVISWLDFLCSSLSEEESNQVIHLLRTQGRDWYCWCPISFRSVSRQKTERCGFDSMNSFHVSVLIGFRRYEGWLCGEEKYTLSANADEQACKGSTAKLFVNLPFKFRKSVLKAFGHVICCSECEKPESLCLFLLPSFLKQFLTQEEYQASSLLKRRSVISGEWLRRLNEEIKKTLENFSDITGVYRTLE